MWNNTVTLSGNLTKDIDVEKTADDVSMTSFIIAVNRKKKDEADFFFCTAFRREAEYLGSYGKKGSRVTLQGHLNTYTVTKDDQNITMVKVIVDSVHVDRISTE